MIRAIGMVELNSIAQGLEVADGMLKRAEVDLLVAKTTCPGKYMVLVSGDVAAVENSVTQGQEIAGVALVDSFIIPNVHESILPALTASTVLREIQALGVIEGFSIASLIEAADAAVKAADVEPLRIHIAFGIGGKSYVVLTGEVSAVRAAVAVGAKLLAQRGLLVKDIVIPRPAPSLAESLL